MAEQTTTQVQTNIPDYIRPYVESMLGRVQSLTTTDPPPQYNGPRIAGASGLQNQSYTGAASMRPSTQNTQATTMAGSVGSQAGQMAQFTPGSFNGGTWGAGPMQQYMSPYQQGVIDIGKREAIRGADMMREQQGAQAVGAGAFGGTRHALVDAERERNLGQRLDDMQMTGMNAAYQNAQQAFNADMGRGLQAQQLGEQSRQYGAGLGMQGLQTQLGAAGLLKDIGTSDYNQRIGIAGLQNQFGTQQQMNQQAGLDHNYQQWQNTINWPYKQLEFQNSMYRGMPMSQSTTTLTQPSPSPLSQMAGIGAMAYGLSRPMGMAEGGMVDGYAGGGEVGMPQGAPMPAAPMPPPSRGAGLADLLISQIR